MTTTLRKATLRNFNTASYTARICLDGGYKVDLQDVSVARNIPSTAMVAGRKLAVLFFDDHNPREAVVIAVYTPYP